MRRTILTNCLLFLVGFMTLPCFGLGTELNGNKFYPGSERFEEDIQNFKTLGKKQPPTQSAIVCIGSSSMLGWHKTIMDNLHMTRNGYLIWLNKLKPILLKEDLKFEPQEDITLSADKTTLMVAGLTPKGWELYDKVLRFIPENLYEHINGRAEYYLSFNMITMTFAGFRKSTDNSNFINLSIYDMSNPSNAFGVFSGERSLGAPPLKLGRDAYRSKANYYIWHGQYYIQIVATDTTSELQRISMDLAEKLTNNLQDSGQPVWGLQVLPQKNQVPQSVQYFLIDALGYSFLPNTYTAKYYKDKIEVSVFLSKQDSPESVRTTIIKLKEHVNKYGKGVDLLSVDGIELLSCDMGKYYDVIFQKGCLAAGVIGVKDKELAIGAAIDLWKQLKTE